MSNLTQPISDYIIYLRKSRSDDPAKSVEEVLANHERELQEFCVREFGSRMPENNIFREVVSGETIDDRPVMKTIMKLLESGSIKGILIVEPQRLSRGDLQDCGRIINALRYTGTLAVTPNKTYDLTDEYDRKFFEMELTRGNDYLEYTKKILSRGRIASVKKGNFIGTIPPYGYKKVQIGKGKDKCYTLEVVPEEAEALKIMYHLFVHEHYGFKLIANHLDSLGIQPRHSDHWNPAAIKDMLENPVYIGKIRWNWRKTEKKIVDGKIVKTRPKTDQSEWLYVDGLHEPIIDIDTFNAALDRRGKNPRITKGKELSNPYAGLLFCKRCGKAMSHKRFVQKRKTNNNICESMLCNNQSICHTKSVKFISFQNRVIEILQRTIFDFEIKLKNDDGTAAKLHQNIITTLEIELKKLRERDARQKDAYEDGTYSKEEYASRNAKLQEKITETIASLENARENIPEEIDYQTKILKLSECISSLQDDTIPAVQKNALLKTCIERIEYTNNMDSKPGIGRYIENSFELDIFLRI